MSQTASPSALTKMGNHRRDQLLRAVAQVQLLPSTLVVPMRMIELQRDRTATIADFAEALSCDPALVAKVLGLVNSAAFKPARPVTRVSDALVMIGLKNLLPLVFGASLGGIYNPFSLPADERGGLWRGALLKSIAARECARVVAPAFAEEAMILGLMQDVALPLMYSVDRSSWAELLSILELPGRAAREGREEKLLGANHAELAGRLSARVGLPPVFAAAAAAHHGGVEALTAAVGGERGLGQALALAAALPHRVAAGNGAALKGEMTAALRAAGPVGTLSPAEFWLRTSTAFARTLGQMGDQDERGGAFKAFMQALCGEVATCLESAIEHNTQVIFTMKEREEGLEKDVAELRQQVAESDFDLLTQVLNRKGFLRRAQKLMTMVAAHKAPSVIGFVDVDDFKAINDGRGHDAGDRALVTVARRLTELISKTGVVGRLGGDEFAFVAFGKDAAGLAAIIDDVRGRLCRLDAALEDGPLALTCSVGIAGLTAASVLGPLEEPLRRADELMYEAKRGGRGRCAVGAVGPAVAA